MNFPQQPTPTNAYAHYANRPIRGIFPHHTATTQRPTPRLGSSWNHLIDRDPAATIYQAVPLEGAPHCVLKTDLWRPPWIVRCPDGRVSDANYCGLHVEIVYDPSSPNNQLPTSAQVQSLGTLIDYYYDLYGPLPIVGHGEVQSDKWRTEPHPWPDVYVAQLNLSDKGVYGRFRLTTPPQEAPVVEISDEDLKAYMEQLGTPINPDTALMQRAYLAYRRGETRGPAISGEYTYLITGHVRQRFTAGIADYDPATGGVSWAEVVAHPE